MKQFQISPGASSNKSRIRGQITFLLLTSILVYFLSARFDLLETFEQFSRQHENLELDELLCAIVVLAFMLTAFCFNWLRELGLIRNELNSRNIELSSTVASLRQSKESLQQQEAHVRLLLDSTAEAIYGLDIEGNCTFCNRACIELLGFTREEELLGQKIHHLIHHSPLEDHSYLCEECPVHPPLREGKRVHSDSEVFWRADGVSFPVEYWVHPVIQDGAVVGAVVTFLDISQRRRMEHDLILREGEFRTLVENSPAVIMRYDTDLRRLYVNPAWERVFGRPAEKVLGETVFDNEVTPGSMVASYAALLRKALKTGTTQRKEFPWVNAHGKMLFLEYVVVPEFCPEGKATSVLVVGHNTTERKQAEENLRKTLNFLTALLDQSPVSIRVFDGTNGNCISANPAAAKLAGGPAETLLSHNFRTILPWQEAGLTEIAEKVLASGETCQIEKEMTTSFGKPLVFRYFFSRFYAEEKPNLLVIGQDISEEKGLAVEKCRLEEKILHTQKLESLGVLAGGIAHDFNNILMTVLGNSDLALRRIPAESPAVWHLQQIQQAANQAADLSGQMLAYSGRGKFVVEHLDLNKIIQEMMHMLEVSLSKKSHLRLSLGQDLPGVEADMTQIRQIIMNLVINASEAIGDRNGVIGLTTGTMDCSRAYLSDTWLDEDLAEGPYVFLEVTDSGCGMAPETVQRIFDPFFTTKFAGRGLGMAAVMGIIRGHKGGIKVYSEEGKGTTFKVLLPSKEIPKIQGAFSDTDSHWRGRGKILLVDDEEAVRAVGRAMLQDLGFEVVCAGNGREALDIYKEHRQTIHLIVMDLTMPYMGGEEAFQELRRLDSEVKVIMTSGYNEQEVVCRFSGKRLTGFLQKPFQLAGLQRILMDIGIDEP
jgi:PAS domain S-box-containing protein